MLRKSWLIILTCGLIVSPVLFGLEVIPGAAAWLLFLGFASLIVATLVLGEQTRKRSSRSPAGLLQDCRAGASGDRFLTAGEQSGRISPFAK